jgi:hypothetical protein
MFLSLLFQNMANGQTDPQDQNGCQTHHHRHHHGPVYQDARWNQGGHQGDHCGGGNDSSSSSGSSSDTDCDCDCGGDLQTLNGKISWDGDPHGHVKVTVDGQQRDLNFDTNGTGLARMFDSDKLDVDAQLEGEPSKTFDRADTITAIGSDGEKVIIKVDAKTDKVTVDGQDLNGTYSQHGITVTKDGNKTTVTLADGTKVTCDDKGDHLDTEIDLHNMKTHELGGVFGTAARTGQADADITHFPARDHAHDGGSSGAHHDYADYHPRDPQWAYTVCSGLASRYPDGHFMKALFTTLAQFFQSSGFSHNQPIRV